MGTSPGVAKLAHVLSRRPLYRIRADWRAGLVFRHAAALSARCARHTHKGIAANAHPHPDTFPYPDERAHLDSPPDAHAGSESYREQYARALEHAIAAAPNLYPADGHSMRHRFLRAEWSAV